jgi:prolyl oligopeptidase
MKIAILFFLLFFFAISSAIAQLIYPITKKVDQSDVYFGIKVQDPYRWFENDTSEEVKNWIKEENKVTRAYFSQISFREKIKQEINDLIGVPFYTSPSKVGKYYFYSLNTGLQPQSVFYRQEGLSGKGELFIDPNTLSVDGTTRVSLEGHSEDGTYICTTTRKAGSDWAEINVLEVATGIKLPDVLKWVKASPISWRGKGFFYSRYPAQPPGKELTGKNENHKIYFHELGRQQEQDRLIFEDRANPLRSNTAYCSEDKRFLFIFSFLGQNNIDIYYRDFSSADSSIKLLIKGIDNGGEDLIGNNGGKLIFATNRNAPNGKIVLVDPNYPDPANWKTLISEQPELLENTVAIGGRLFLCYLKDVTSKCYQFSYEGKLEREIKLPDLGRASGFRGDRTDSFVFYTFSSFLYPRTIFKYNMRTGESEKYFVMDMKMKPEDYQTKQVFFASKDGTKVPMFIVSKAAIRLDGSHPTLLYAYGGYAHNSTPYFDPTIFPLLDAGGIYAVANIRGGGEYGEKWHAAGMLLNTQNRFDDFIAAAQFLISNKYTSAEKLGIYGASHGGCLVGSVMLQRPDLFKVAIVQVGALDMLRFNKFTVGWSWVSEYGHPDSLADFMNLLAYSPVHNVKNAVAYPATLVMTGDHDDRVVPMHSFKFIAELQAKQAGVNPVVIRIDTNSGHGGSSRVKFIDDFAEILSFLFYNTNTEPGKILAK